MNAMSQAVSPQSTTGCAAHASITLCGNYQVENFFDFQTGDHDTETVNSTLALNGNGFVGAASPDEAVRLAVSGTITLGGLSWLPNPPDTFVFPRDLTANAANGNWQKFRFAADSYNSNTSSWTVTLQFIDDDRRDPWRADFDGSYCRLTVIAAPPRLSLTATDAADATNHATAIAEPIVNLPATIPDLYVAADANDEAHIDLSAAFGPASIDDTPTGELVNLCISPTNDSDPNDVVRSGTYADLLNSGGLNDILLSAAHDYVINGWLYDAGVEALRTIYVHLLASNLRTFIIQDNATVGDTLLPHDRNSAPGAYVPVNNDDDAYDHYASSSTSDTDLNAAGPIAGEDDLLPFFVDSVQPPGGGNYIIRIDDGAGIKFYTGTDKTGAQRQRLCTSDRREPWFVQPSPLRRRAK